MRNSLLKPMGLALRERRRTRRMTQDMLATRLSRSASRISELEKDMVDGRISKDRLGLLSEVCDALDLVPILVPRERVAAVRRVLDEAPHTSATPVSRVFDDLFVDLGEAADEGGAAPDGVR